MGGLLTNPGWIGEKFAGGPRFIFLPSPRTPLIEALQLAAYCAKILEEKHARDIVVLDLRDSCNLADFFILSTADSSRQFRAIAETLDAALTSYRIPLKSVEGLEAGTWVLIDLYDVIVHMFEPEARQFYDLEVLWGDAPRVPWADTETPAIPRAATTTPRPSRALRTR